MNGFLEYVSANYEYIGIRLLEHIEYTIIAVGIAILVGVPVGIMVFEHAKIKKGMMGLINIIQAIPSLAALGVLIPYMGIGAGTAIFMVVLYSLLPILKNTCTGLENIDSNITEAAQGIGMTKVQILTKVQLPLALPVIMTGVRISSVTAVGLMTIAAYIGAGGLGTLVLSGIQTDNSNMILAGAIPACLLAMFMDFVMSYVEKLVTPAALRLQRDALVHYDRAIKKKQKRLFYCAMGIVFVLFGVFYLKGMTKPNIIIGSKDGCENVIIGNMIADVIESKTGLKVERKLALGGTMIAYGALAEGKIDLYPEYTGTAYSTILKKENRTGISAEYVYSAVKDGMSENGIDILQNIGFENTYVLAVSKEISEQYNLKSISDIKKMNGKLRLGCTPEFAGREDGLTGLENAYGISFKSVNNFSGTLMYTAIQSSDVDVITAFSTDGLLSKYDLVLLDDDLGFFPPYFMLPMLNHGTAEKYPEIAEALSALNNLIDNETMQRLNYEVVEVGRTREEVARTFLKEHGIIE